MTFSTAKPTLCDAPDSWNLCEKLIRNNCLQKSVARKQATPQSHFNEYTKTGEKSTKN